MNRHNVLFVDHAAGLGGAEQSLLLLCRHLDLERWRPHLVCVPGPLAQQAAAAGVATHTIAMPRLRRSPTFLLDWLDSARAIAAIAGQVNAALLHANTVRAAIYTALAARLARRPFVWHMRDFWLSENEPGRLWADRLGKQLLCASAQAVIANSASVAAGLPCPRHVTVVHNGIELERFDPGLDSTPFRRQHGIPPDAPVAGMVGRLRPWKGQATFLQAAARIGERMPAAHFLIVGGDPFQVGDNYAGHLRRVAAGLGLEGRATFTGHLDDVRPALAAMNVFVHPGVPEPFGLVNLEAMAMGKPVVGFAHGALPEIIVGGQSGLLVTPGDAGALAYATQTLLEDPAKAQAMGQAGRTRAQTSFDIRQTAERIGRLYTELIGQDS